MADIKREEALSAVVEIYARRAQHSKLNDAAMIACIDEAVLLLTHFDDSVRSGALSDTQVMAVEAIEEPEYKDIRSVVGSANLETSDGR